MIVHLLPCRAFLEPTTSDSCRWHLLSSRGCFERFEFWFTQDGGLWINLGPLQYHWADAQSYVEDPELAHSLEISLEDVERMAVELGFKTLRREMLLAGFNTNSRCVSWVKKLRGWSWLCYRQRECQSCGDKVQGRRW